MTVHLDTSLLVDACCAPFRSLAALRAATAASVRTSISMPVLYEWLRGPRLDHELHAQEALAPADEFALFDAVTARTAARIYRRVKRPRGREIDIMIAACAIEQGAALWTLSPDDFADIPGLTLYRP